MPGLRYSDKRMSYVYGSVTTADESQATNGYDGSMVNGLQALTPWKDCMALNLRTSRG
jgi:hypothetical protein